MLEFISLCPGPSIADNLERMHCYGNVEDINNFISLEPSFETSGSNDQVRVD